MYRKMYVFPVQQSVRTFELQNVRMPCHVYLSVRAAFLRSSRKRSAFSKRGEVSLARNDFSAHASPGMQKDEDDQIKFPQQKQKQQTFTIKR